MKHGNEFECLCLGRKSAKSLAVHVRRDWNFVPPCNLDGEFSFFKKKKRKTHMKAQSDRTNAQFLK